MGGRDSAAIGDREDRRVAAALHQGRRIIIRFRDRGARGRHQGGQIDAQHSFSFADYNDPAHMGFRDLRVLNEDRIVPGAGLPAHDHADMEIVTIVLKGAVEHRDVHVGREVGGPLTAEDTAYLRGLYAIDMERLRDLTGISFL